MQKVRLSWHRISAAELELCLRCNRVSRRPALRTVFVAASRLGDGCAWYGLIAALPLIYGSTALAVALRMSAAGLCGVLIYKWLKNKTLRPRPYQLAPAIEAASAPLDRYSFPSGHTLHAASFTTIACAHYPELAPGLVPLACVIAASRPILGLHYPSDVLAGAALGFSIAQIALCF